jgi:hypothetical protein
MTAVTNQCYVNSPSSSPRRAFDPTQALRVEQITAGAGLFPEPGMGFVNDSLSMLAPLHLLPARLDPTSTKPPRIAASVVTCGSRRIRERHPG